MDPGRPLVVYVTPELGERVAFSLEEAARLLGCSKWLVRQAVKDGKLHVVELGPQARLIPAWSIDELLGRPATVTSLSQTGRDDAGAAA